MKKHHIHAHVVVLAIMAAAVAGQAKAQPALVPLQIAPEAVNSPYLVDSSRVIVRNSSGQCWRTGFWTPEAASKTRVVGLPLPAGCYCEESMQSQAVCTVPAPVVAPPVVVAPPPPPAPVPTAEKVTIPADTLFNFDKDTLSAEGKTTLDGLLVKMQRIDLEAVVAVGYADRIGSASYNHDLSTRRAQTIKTYLVETGGIEASRVFIEGRGESAPVTGDSCTNMGAERGSNKKLVACLAPDRRVVIEAVGAAKR